MSDVKHTPTPWKTRQFETVFEVRSDDGMRIVQTSWHDTIRHPYPLKAEAQANAAHIVRCVNLHDELVAIAREAKALAAMAVMSDDEDGAPSEDQRALEALRGRIDAIIAKAEAS